MRIFYNVYLFHFAEEYTIGEISNRHVLYCVIFN